MASRCSASGGIFISGSPCPIGMDRNRSGSSDGYGVARTMPLAASRMILDSQSLVSTQFRRGRRFFAIITSIRSWTQYE